MQNSQIALIRCNSYNPEEVYNAVKRGINLLGGMENFFHKNEKILLKPNLLGLHRPEDCVTTHPEVFRAVGKIFQEYGISLSYGDSAPKGSTKKIAKISGLAKVSNDLNIPFVDFEEKETLSYPKGRIHKQFTIAKVIGQNDGLVSLPKFKTHNLTRITGAVKNQFGCISGFLKPEFHVKLPSIPDFSKMLIELNLMLKPRFFIMDAVMAMEGNGPAAGTPKKLNCLIISKDPVAIDSIACKIINLKPERVDTNHFGYEFGLGNFKIDKIEILGDKIEDFFAPNFNVQRGPSLENNSAMKFRFLKNIIALKPKIKKQKCIKCGECINHCPVKPVGIKWGKKKLPYPIYDYNYCIRCYCCQEVCPNGAIEIKTPFLRKILDRMFR